MGVDHRTAADSTGDTARESTAFVPDRLCESTAFVPDRLRESTAFVPDRKPDAWAVLDGLVCTPGASRSRTCRAVST